MAVAFTEQEIEYLRKKAIEVAGRMVSAYGMRKANLDQIMQEVGASKLTFYKLFESKEHLFLAFLIDFHEQMLAQAITTIHEHPELPMKERLVRCLIYAAKQIDGYQMHRFMTEDFPVLLRKLPEARSFHFEDHGDYVKKFIKATGTKFRVTKEVAAVIIHTLVLSVIHKREASDNDTLFWVAFEQIARGAIDRIVITED